MTVIDVNTGKFVGSGGNLEETVTKNNLEAAEEIVRQLRLRDIGGIIVVDFIDMVLESNRDLVLRRLVECLSRDRTKHQVAEVTSLGLVQMTRKKLGLGLLETFSEPCEVCAGRGVIVHHDPVTRHRAPQPPERRRGGKGGGQAQTAPANGGGSSNNHTGTHAVTASTLHTHQDEAAEAGTEGAQKVLSGSAHTGAAVADSAENSATDVAAEDAAHPKHLAEGEVAVPASSGKQDAPRGRRGSRGRGARRVSDDSAKSGATETPEIVSAQDEAPATTASRSGRRGDSVEQDAQQSLQPAASVRGGGDEVAAVSILDIPVAPHADQKPAVDPVQAQEILGSVLDALPEPKKPGQGRARRRVTTAGLTGGTVATQADDSQAS
jgi:ribonuclease E